MNSSADIILKILVVGDSGVGKSCLLLRLVDDVYSDNYISTIGVDFKIHTVNMDGRICKMQIWDTAGQERFRTITDSYYRGAHGVVMVYDVSDPATFANIKSWSDQIDQRSQTGVVKLLIGNKCDLSEIRVDRNMVQEYAAAMNIPFVETSAKNSTNVQEAFFAMARRIIGAQAVMNADKERLLLKPKDEQSERTGCC